MNVLPHAYLIEMVIGVVALGTLGLSAWCLREAWLDWLAERHVRTSNLALRSTWGNLCVEVAQLAQVGMLVWFGVRMSFAIPPDVAGHLLDPAQLNQARLVFLAFVLLKAMGRYLERRVRRDVSRTYRQEFVQAGRTWKPADEEH